MDQDRASILLELIRRVWRDLIIDYPESGLLDHGVVNQHPF